MEELEAGDGMFVGIKIFFIDFFIDHVHWELILSEKGDR